MKKTVIIGIIFMAFTWGITSKADNLDSETQNSTEYHTSIDIINSLNTEKLQTSDSINESNNLEDFSFSEKYINIKANINDFLRSGELFQDQANIFLGRLDQATTIDELNVLWSDIKKQIAVNESFVDFSFSEKYINTKANINDFLRSGELFQDQANIFLSRLDQATTIDELNVLWSDIKKQIADNKMSLSSSASTEKNSSSNSNQNSSIQHYS